MLASGLAGWLILKTVARKETPRVAVTRDDAKLSYEAD
jgi:hypothetical protein